MLFADPKSGDTSKLEIFAMPGNWEPTLTAWKTMLDKPKNAGLKAGGGTGVSQAVRNVQEAEGHFNQPHFTTANSEALSHALDALTQTCQDTINKHQKLFTEACNFLGEVSHSANARKTQVTTQVQGVIRDILHECQVADLAIRAAGTNRNAAGQAWLRLKNHLVNHRLDERFPKLKESIKVITTMIPPNDQRSQQPLSNFTQAISRLDEAVKKPNAAAARA